MSRELEPSDRIVDHFTEKQLINRLTSCFVRSLEPQLVVQVDGRLPEKLDEARKIKSIVIVGLEQSFVDL